MLDAYFGMRTRPLLRRLQERGLVRAVRHRPEEGEHCALTEAGAREAWRMLEHGPSSAPEARA